MEEEGIVVRVTGATASVRMDGGGGCDSCASSGACKAGSGDRVLDADNPIGAAEGQRVLVRICSAGFLKASFIVYMGPVVALFAGAILGGEAGPGIYGGISADAWQAIGGVLFLAVSLAGIRLYDRNTRRRGGLRPVIVKALEGRVCVSQR